MGGAELKASLLTPISLYTRVVDPSLTHSKKQTYAYLPPPGFLTSSNPPQKTPSYFT